MTSVKLQASTAQALQKSPDHLAQLLGFLTGSSQMQQEQASSSSSNGARSTGCTKGVGSSLFTTSDLSSSSSSSSNRGDKERRSRHTSASPSPAAAAATMEPLLRLLCNLCGNKQLRQMLADQPELVEQLLNLAIDTLGSQDTRLQALSCLCNLLLENKAAAAAAAAPGLGELLLLGCPQGIVGVKVSSSSGSSRASDADLAGQANGSSSRVMGLGGVHLPLRRPSASEERVGVSGAAQSAVLADKALVVLSRVVRVEAGVQLLLDIDADVMLVQALQRHLQRRKRRAHGATEGRKQGASRDPEGAGRAEEGSEILGDGRIDASVRCICALLSGGLKKVDRSSSSSRSGLRSQLPRAAAEALLCVMADPAAGEAVVGNAALGLGFLASCPGLEDVFHKSQAVEMLVGVMKKGKGDAASRNAAITLAKLARDARMLGQLRELRGLEVMYQYIKP